MSFKFTIKIGPDDEERGLVGVKNRVREADTWENVPLAAIPIIQKGWPEMPDFMNGRQYFLWWKNEFKLQDSKDKPGSGQPEILNPLPQYTKLEYFRAGEGSRRWGA